MSAVVDVRLDAAPVELYKLLKWQGLFGSGGEAKAAIAAGGVRVNGLVETRKRRKIGDGDLIDFAGHSLRVHT